MAPQGAISLFMQRFAFDIPHKDPRAVFTALAAQPYSLWLDSAAAGDDRARYSFIVWHPRETIESKDGRVTVTNADQQLSLRADPFKVLRDRMDAYGADIVDDPTLPPFQGGAAGLFGYDLARGIERLPAQADDSRTMPDMAVGIYDKIYAFDHHANKAWFIAMADDEAQAQIYFAQFRRLTAVPRPIGSTTPAPQWQPRESRAGYKKKVERVIDYIRAGDIFQANLSQQFTANVPAGFDPFAHYCVLRAVNPAPFAAYMNIGGVKIASASPERFLQTRDGHVETRPIKGTRPRKADKADDESMARELAASAKDRAENAMIVDLLRNDLSKVCTDDSINVPQLCAVESFASVHHLVSVVTGTLRGDCGPVDLLRACFPGGSITGAPKVRAMEIIEELEPVRRGPYCGSIGYIGFGGTMDSSILIRTIVYDGKHMTLNVGGGIVADSAPEEEYCETLDKGRAIFRSFETADRKDQGAGG